jgi:hypothetical protein
MLGLREIGKETNSKETPIKVIIADLLDQNIIN